MSSPNQVDPHTTRWTVASLTDYFQNTVNTSITPVPPFSVTGYSLNSNESEDHIEMRIQGPHEKDTSGGGWLSLEVHLSFLMTFRQDSVKDILTLDRWLGVYKEALRDPIEILKRGSGPDDDNSLLGCLSVKKSKREGLIRIDRYGFMDGNTPVQQATVVALLDTWIPWHE